MRRQIVSISNRSFINTIMENFEILTVKTGRESEGKSIKSVDTPWRQNVERWALLAVGNISPTAQ